jgi:hypothetical protein
MSQTEKKIRLTSPPQIHSLHLRLHPALHHQPAPNPQPARSRMAALPHPNRQRLRSPSLLPRTRPSRHPAPRHPLAIHAVPTSPFPRAETQRAESMGSRSFETPFFENTTGSGSSSSSAAAQPRYRRPAAQRANRTRRTGPDEQRSAETGVPAVQRRRSRGQRRSAQQQQRLQQQGPAFAGRHQTRFNHNSTRQVGPTGFRQQDAVWLAAVSQQHDVYGQVDESRSHHGSAGDVASGGLKRVSRRVVSLLPASVSRHTVDTRLTYLFNFLPMALNPARSIS